MMARKIYFSLLALLAILWKQVATTSPVTSVKINEKIVYDCVNVDEQPSLKHPQLKNHKLQIKPSSWIETRSSIPSEMKKKTLCPTNTVPILRTTHQDKDLTHIFARNISNKVKANKPAMHVAAIVSQAEPPTMYDGIRAKMSVHHLSIAKDQVTLAQMSLSTSINGQDNAVQAGWMINPSLFGDSRPWTFGYWLGSNGHGCYNTLCTGFIQVSSNPLSEPLDSNIPSTSTAFLDVSIHKDVKTGNWWVQNFYEGKMDNIGYWPKELFNQMGGGGRRAVFGGLVGPSPTGSSPPMGNGNLPNGKTNGGAFFINMMLAGRDGRLVNADKFKLLKALDARKCYDLDYNGNIGQLGVTMRYGGPGGSSY